MKNKPGLVVIFLTVFIDLIGFGIVIPILPALTHSLNVQPFFIGSYAVPVSVQVGFIFTSFSLMQFLLSPFWGALSDRVGRRPIILLGLFGSCVSYIIFAYSTTVIWLLISRAFAGVFGANIAVANAYIADITTKENRAKGMGLIGAAFGLGFILGPFIAAMLMGYEGWGFKLPSLAAAAICGVNFLVALFILVESLPPEKRNKTMRYQLIGDWTLLGSRPILGTLVALFFLSCLAFSVFEVMFTLFYMQSGNYYFTASKNAARECGFLLAYIGFLSALVQGGLIGRLAKKYGSARLLIVSSVGFVIGVGFIPVTTGIGSLMLVLSVMALALGLNRPSVFNLLSLNTSSEQQGEVLGIAQSAGSLARIVCYPLAGFLFTITPGLPFWVGGALMVIGLMLSVLLLKFQGTKAMV